MIIEEKQLPFWAEPILVATHKSCKVHLAEFGKELNIQFIESKQEGKGHAIEMIKELLKWCKERNLKLVSSLPISQSWYHLTKKFGLKSYGFK